MWTTLEPRKRIIFILAAVAAFVAILGLVRVATSPNLSLLYAGLDSSAAGDVITQLEQSGVVFDVRGNAIYVDSNSRDQVRLSLAAEGLPASGIAGYEILDSLSGFGTTSQMFDAAYWRAKEGELARTLVASPQIVSARVHIASGSSQPFSRNNSPTAAVTLTAAGGQLAPAFAEAARFMVASAINGMSPENVAVIDAATGSVMLAGDPSSTAPIDGLDTRTATLKTNIERILAARVGPENVIVEVMIDANMQSQTVSERIIDPESRVAISSETQSDADVSSGSGSGAVTVASNLPDGDTGANAGQSSRNQNSNSERINYEVSETLRETTHQPGEIRRLSVAVLVNGQLVTDNNGQQIWAPRPDEELAALRELVQSAIGFDAERGDVVTLQSLEFSETPIEGTLIEDTPGFLSINAMSLIQLGVLSVVVLGLGMFVLRPLLAAQPQPLDLPPLAPDALAADQANSDVSGVPLLGGPVSTTADAASPSAGELLRTAISERSEETNRLLQNWIETPEKNEVPA